MKSLFAASSAVLTIALVVGAACAGIPAAPVQDQQDQYGPTLSAGQLDNLVAPVALYPDPLLAQVLPASTFADQILQAAQWRSTNPDPRGIDGMPWDVSVKAVAHYPTVLNRMSSQIDWTTALGQAYVDQPDDVMAAVQRLRHLAQEEGNLVSTQQQQVSIVGGYIAIDPVQPQYIYVPQYDPAVVYVRRGGPGVIAFSAGLAIGAWLNYDFDWGHNRVFYTGWQGGGWIARSRPDVQITNVYVNNNYRTVAINRTVVQRPVNYATLNRQPAVHANVNYNSVAATRTAVRPAPAPRAAAPERAPAPAPRTAAPERAPAPAPRAAAPERAPAPAPRAAAPERAPAPAPRAAAPERAPAPAPRAAAPERAPAPAPRAAAPERAPAPAPHAAAPERAPAPAPRAAAPERAPAPAPRAAAPSKPAPAPAAKPAPAKEPPKDDRGGGGGARFL